MEQDPVRYYEAAEPPVRAAVGGSDFLRAVSNVDLTDALKEARPDLEVLPCRWGYVRLFNEGDPINFYAVLCRTPQELYDTLENDLAIEKEVQNPQRD